MKQALKATLIGGLFAAGFVGALHAQVNGGGSSSGIASFTASANNFVNGFSGNSFTQAQPATTNLSDYAATSWTPALTFGGASTGITYTTQTGTYVKLGTRIHAEFKIVLSSKGSATGIASITGLPFTSSATYRGSCTISNYASMATVTGFVVNVAPGSTTILVNGTAATGAVNYADTNFGATTTLEGSCDYLTAP